MPEGGQSCVASQSQRGRSWSCVLALVAVAAAGCGGTARPSSSSRRRPPPPRACRADQIVAQSEAKMAAASRAPSFTGDMALKVQGDPSKMTDPTSKALLSQGVTLHAEGKSQNDPVAADVKMSLGLAGQTLDLGHAGAGHQGLGGVSGPVVRGRPEERQEPRATRRRLGAAPTEQLKSLGLDPSALGHQLRDGRHRGSRRHAGLPRQGDGRPAQARRRAAEGGQRPEPRQEARRLQPAQAARAEPHAEQEAGRAAEEEPQERRPWTTGSAWTTS